MESTPQQIRFHITAKVLKIFYDMTLKQWMVHLDGSWESLGLGAEHPGWKVGDMIHVTLEKIDV